MKNKKIEIIEVLFLISFYLALFCFMIDVFVSYNAFKNDKEYFINNEYNKWLVAELKDNIPFFQTSVIFLMFILYPLLFFLYREIKHSYNKYFIKIFLWFFTFMLISQIIKHIIGALSW